MSSLMLSRLSRERVRGGRAARLSSAMSADAQIEEMMLKDLGETATTKPSLYVEPLDGGSGFTSREQSKATYELTPVKHAEITVDPLAFADADAEIEVDHPVPPLPCREVTLEIVARQPAEFRFIPEEFEGYGEDE